MSEAKKGGEREFLHEISSPLAALQLHLESLEMEAPRIPGIDPDFCARLEKCMALLIKATELLSRRKAGIISGLADSEK